MSEGLVAEVATEASAHGAVWFPELDASRVVTRELRSDVRARCFLHHVELYDGRTSRVVVVKVRHSQQGLRHLDRYEQRPMLNPERTMSDTASARREFEALMGIADAFDGADASRFGVLRPLAWLPCHSAIVMDLVEDPTLRRRLLATSRFRMRPHRPMQLQAWVNAGAWLRRFHDRNEHLTGQALPARMATRTEVAGLYEGLGNFLLDRVGAVPALRQIAMAPDAVARVFPQDLPLAAGHGDYVANNMFAGPEGRVTVFDPLPRWRVPRYQDLATLTVGTRLLPLQATSQGVAFRRSDLTGYEEAVLRGYFAAERPPRAELSAYQLLVLLDRWAALVSKTSQSGGLRTRRRALRVHLTSRQLGREAALLLDRLPTSGNG